MVSALANIPASARPPHCDGEAENRSTFDSFRQSDKKSLTLELVPTFRMSSMKNRLPGRGYLRAGELAQAAEISTDTLRHYERKGLLRPRRSSNGYREYPEGAVERVSLIRRALVVGFTLDELSAVFKVLDAGGVPCQQVRSLAATKLVELENHLQDVTVLRDELRESLKDWDARLAKASGQRAGLLKALVVSDRVRHSSTCLLSHKLKLKKKGKRNV